jgi:hypothetical protein
VRIEHWQQAPGEHRHELHLFIPMSGWSGGRTMTPLVVFVTGSPGEAARQPIIEPPMRRRKSLIVGFCEGERSA